jgi:hypothetical protein
MSRSNAVARGGFTCAMAELITSNDTIAEQSNFIVIHLCRVLGFTNGHRNYTITERNAPSNLPSFAGLLTCAILKGDA